MVLAMELAGGCASIIGGDDDGPWATWGGGPKLCDGPTLADDGGEEVA